MILRRPVHRHCWPVLIASVACVAALVIATAFTATRGHGGYQARVAAALEDGTLGRAVILPFGPARPYYQFAFNDCLILSMLTVPDGGTAAERIVSPLVPLSDGGVPDGFPPYSHCAALASTLAGTADGQGWRYHRYLHGHRALAGLLLHWLPLGAASALLALAALAPYLAVAGLAMAALLRRRSADPGRHAAYLTLAVALPLLTALPVYGRSFGFAPSDMVLGIALLAAYRHRAWAARENLLVAGCATFGALTAIFEFLSGGRPAGFVLLVAIAAFEGRHHDAGRRLALMLAAYALAFGLCFAVKLGSVMIVWGPSELTSVVTQLALRVGHAEWDVAPENAARLAAFGLSVETLQSGRLAGTAFAFGKLAFFSSQLGFGSLACGLVIVLLGPLVLPWCAVRSRKAGADPAARRVWLLLLLAACVVPFWYVVFLNHTIVHAHFMVRLLAWPTALALAGLAWSRAHHRSRPAGC